MALFVLELSLWQLTFEPTHGPSDFSLCTEKITFFLPPVTRVWTVSTVTTAALICTTSMGHTVARSAFLCQLLSKLKRGSGGGRGPPLSRWIVQETSQFAFKDAKGLGCMFKSISNWLSYNIGYYIFPLLPCNDGIAAWLLSGDPFKKSTFI